MRRTLTACVFILTLCITAVPARAAGNPAPFPGTHVFTHILHVLWTDLISFFGAKSADNGKIGPYISPSDQVDRTSNSGEGSGPYVDPNG